MCNDTRKGQGPGTLHRPGTAPDPLRNHLCSPEAVSGLHVLEWLAAVQAGELKLCCLLERIADQLPSALSRSLVSPAVPGLRVVVTRHDAILRHLLLPRLRATDQAGSEDADPMIERFSRCNATDTLLAHDAADLLEAAMLKGGYAENPGMLAYVLRGFFDGRRRHIEWEKTVLVPLAEARLRPDHLAPLDEFEVRLILASGCRGDDEFDCR